jgi:YebC/PmpR family DNA-binding regulatory protein
MSGHSKWSTIKRAKGLTDIKRGQVFTKLAGAISISVKQGNSGDPDANPRLRMAIEAARAVNMPKDNIDRAIAKGLGVGKEALEEVTYEGFGPGHTAFIVEGITDNRLRTNQEVKSIFDRNGGSMANPGAVSYMFEKVGEIRVKGKGGDMEEELLELIDLGASDVEDFLDDGTQKYLVYTESSELNTMGIKITQAGYGIESQELVMKPTTLQTITDKELAEKVMNFAEKLEDQADTQKVFSNFDIPEELVS